jgi:hypothetical protein
MITPNQSWSLKQFNQYDFGVHLMKSWVFVLLTFAVAHAWGAAPDQKKCDKAGNSTLQLRNARIISRFKSEMPLSVYTRLRSQKFLKVRMTCAPLSSSSNKSMSHGGSMWTSIVIFMEAYRRGPVLG